MQPEIEDNENTGPALKNTKYKIQDSAWMRPHHSSHRGSGVGRICRARQWLEIINGEFPLMGLPTACRGIVENYQKLKGKKEILKQLWEFQRNMITGNRSLERQQLNNKAVELKTRFPLGCLSACLPSWLQAGGVKCKVEPSYYHSQVIWTVWLCFTSNCKERCQRLFRKNSDQ